MRKLNIKKGKYENVKCKKVEYEKIKHDEKFEIEKAKHDHDGKGKGSNINDVIYNEDKFFEF